MSRSKLDTLLDNQSMVIHIFDGRYSDGIIAFVAATSEGACAIENAFTGGDQEWERVRFSLQELDWYPIVFAASAMSALTALYDKVDKIVIANPDVHKLCTCIELVGNIVEQDKTLRIRNNIKELCDLSIEKREELLFDIRDAE